MDVLATTTITLSAREVRNALRASIPALAVQAMPERFKVVGDSMGGATIVYDRRVVDGAARD